MISIKQAFEDLYDRMLKQLVETMWTIERVEPMSQKEVEEFQGESTQKKLIIKKLKQELKERQDNIKTLEKILKKYE